MLNPLQKRIDIDVSLVRPKSPRAQLPRLCVVGIVPYDFPIISEVSPNCTIRKSLFAMGQPFVEQVRLSSIIQAKLLPAINNQFPSKLRDSLISILTCGTDEADFILARAPGVRPWDLSNQQVVEMIMPFFNDVPGAMIVFPDAGGPWPRGWKNEDFVAERQTNLINTIKIYSSAFSENFQLAFCDIMDLPDAEAKYYLHSLLGNDVSLCSWSGSFYNLQRHGWRSAASFVAGYLAKRVDVVTQSLVGHQINLGSGRKVVASRAPLLGGAVREPIPPSYEDNCVVLDIVANGNKATVLSEFTMRRPRYEWNIPAIRTVKAIHQSLRQAADIFVFRPVQKVEAIALATAVEMVLNPFYELGILVGPSGEGKPSVEGDAIPDNIEPMLSVELSAMVRPWCQNINLKVMVKSGMEPLIEEA
jgi:hypothetical protein